MSQGLPEPRPTSPPWSAPTRLVVALVLLTLTGALLLRFIDLIGPLLLAFILAYLLSPVTGLIARTLRMPWGRAVTLTYLVLVLVLGGAAAGIGVILQQQVLGLYQALANIFVELPVLLTRYLSEPIVLGPLVLDPAAPEWQPLYIQLNNLVQMALAQVGMLIGRAASSTLVVIGWLIFVFFVSYYLLHDIGRLGLSLETLVPTPYRDDARRLISELGPIWNAWLRGQFILAAGLGVAAWLAMSLLGVRYAPGLGLLAFVLEFIPILGPTLLTAVAVLVALFQGGNWLGVNQVVFAALVLVTHFLLQQIQNNVFVPRIMGHHLRLHPVAVLVGVVIMAQLLGVAGLLLAAPLVATLRLFGGYIYRKVVNLNPWPEPTTAAVEPDQDDASLASDSEAAPPRQCSKGPSEQPP